MIESLISQGCTLVNRVESEDEIDDYGKPLVQEDSTETVCYLEQRQRSEDASAGETSSSDWLAVFREDEDVNTASALIVDGVIYEFVGAPWPVRDPELDVVSHIEATVRFSRRVEGS